ncbi:uncharacterized protein LOC134819750 [Bolinopsis microptera]|uniref:uncharacterized protein LOC134819750 n=1 Tax=Bolinopsis microptera TaxID=2820187 RepID=UPI00307A6004
MSLLVRNLGRIVSRSNRILSQKRCIQTSTAASGGGGEYSELSDYNLYLWDRPSGFEDGPRPHKEYAWERMANATDIEDYYIAMSIGILLALCYGLFKSQRKLVGGDEVVKLAEERIASGILVDLFPDQKEHKIYVNNREMFPDHDPHTYDPTADRDYFWIQ